MLVSNPDLVVHPGTLDALRRRARVASPPGRWSGRGSTPRPARSTPRCGAFPSFTDAAGHALLAVFKPENPFTKRYNPGTPEGDVVTGAGWVSGSCFLARRAALEELGGFDEAYFMYLEDTDLCWRAHHAGWGVGFAGTAAVTHVQGVSTARDPYRMMVAHHRSALRFTFRTTTGWRRLALPLAVLVLGARLAMATLRIARGRGALPARRGARRRARARRRAGARPHPGGGGGGGGVGPRPPTSTSSPRSTSRCPRGRRVHRGDARPGGRHPGTDRGQHGGGPGGRDVNVCIGGQGPFPFVLDSGAGQSTIDAHLASRLHLASAGQSTLFAGVDCTGTAKPVSVGQWSLEGVDLAPQQLTSATLPQIGGKGEPVGLLGSDVLARFGVVRIDFVAGDLVLPGPQGPPLTSDTSYTGPIGPAPPPVLTQGGGTTLPLTVYAGPGRRLAQRRRALRRRGRRRTFVVDTGSSQSVVSTRWPEPRRCPRRAWRNARPRCAR